ncbi:hypothetical protein KC19_12G117300 [Ceratodon purpureus]|uniref:Uncharacterized protein n=1 Tax=Ceratodon purpureus TaxID=3225 RepID=A0A8T0G9V3_CERPU|nr:hypothetical protein KC19_12G117300 [Ceratodon purpureus]
MRTLFVSHSGKRIAIIRRSKQPGKVASTVQ